MAYLDNNATTPLAPEAREAMLPFLDGLFANPSSAHGAGMRVRTALAEARDKVATLIGAKPAEIVFTASATEANHLAILGSIRGIAGRGHVVATAVEHPATLMLLREVERMGWRLTLLPVGRSGCIDLAELDAAVTDDTALVSVMWANNETGVCMPVAEAAAIAKARGALFHTDAVQAVGRAPVDMRSIGADLLSFSGHKLHGPKGVGVLAVRRDVTLLPLIHGHQERRRRGGTENVPAIVGLGVAAELAAAFVASDGPAGIAVLRDRLEAGVLGAMPGSRVNGDAPRLVNTSNIGFADPRGRPMPGEALLIKLDQAGIQVAMGAACASSGKDGSGMAPSHVLLAMGLEPDAAAASLRFSLSRYSTEADIRVLLEALPPLCARLAA